MKKKKTYADGIKDAWEIFNKHGIGVMPGGEASKMFITVSYGESQDKLVSNVTFTRPSEDGILSWLPDKDWQELKARGNNEA
jgi:hypothetical protein